VFQNPLLERVLDFFVVAGEETEDVPELVLGSAGGRDTLDSEPVPNSRLVYRAHHLAGAAAAETIYVTATDLYGNEGTDFRVITYSRIMGEQMVVTSADGGFTAYASHAAGAVLAILPVDSEYLPAGGDPGIEVGPAAYNLCIMGEGEPTLSVRAGPDGGDAVLCIFEDGWKVVEGQERNGDYLAVSNAGPGIYGLASGLPVPGAGLRISPGVPNPFGETCSFAVSAPRVCRVRMCVYDVHGRLVNKLFNGRAEGSTEVVWDGRNSSGSKVSSGIYFVRAQAGPMVATRKVILVR
jgi:hypothetical protein